MSEKEAGVAEPGEPVWIRESVGAVGPSAWPVGLRGPALTWVGACTSLAWAPPAGPKWAVPLGTPHRAPHFPHLGAKEAAPVSGCSWRVPVCPGGSCDLPWGPKPHSWHLPLDPVAELRRSSAEAWGPARCQVTLSQPQAGVSACPCEVLSSHDSIKETLTLCLRPRWCRRHSHSRVPGHSCNQPAHGWGGRWESPEGPSSVSGTFGWSSPDCGQERGDRLNAPLRSPPFSATPSPG